MAENLIHQLIPHQGCVIMSPRDRNDRRLWIVVAIGIVAIATVVRFAINFSSPYPPGIDAAYYPVQTRSWLTAGRLMYDDLPLIFWLNALVTKGLTIIGWEFDAALLLASRLVDCLGPPWAAAFVMATGYDWSGGRRAALSGSAAAAIVVVLWPPAIAMVSGFEKNSLGFVWMTATAWASAAAMRQGGRRRWATLAILMVLAALTHIGTFAVTALMVGLSLAIWSMSAGRAPGLTRWQTWIVCLAIVLAPGVLVAIFDPRRLMLLVQAPVAMLEQALQGGDGWGMSPALLCVIPVVILGLRCVWQDRRELSRADIAVVTAAAITAIVLLVPQSKETMRRLRFMLPVPAGTVLGFVLARRAVDGRPAWPGRVVLAGAMAVAMLSVLNAGRLVARPQIDLDAAEDLRDMRIQIPEPEATLVIATHGLEWWAGYFLHTPVRVASMEPETYGSVRASVPPDAFQRYQRVLHVRHASRPRADRPATTPAALDPALHHLQTGRVLELFEWR
jgi:hypothetical protein